MALGRLHEYRTAHPKGNRVPADNAVVTDKNERRDVVLLYANRTADEIAYREIFDEAEKKIGMKTIYFTTSTDGRITPEHIKKEIPDYRARIFYISGTRAMVMSFEKILGELGVPRAHIKIDFFPGFA